MVWEPRDYRQRTDAAGLVSFEVVQAETDLQIAAQRDLSVEAAAIVAELRAELEGYVASHPHFAESFVPVAVESSAPEVVRSMAAAAEAGGVGPMAAVAGAVAERVARRLSGLSPEVIVENGGDLYVVGLAQRRILLLAGDSPLSGKVTIVLPEGAAPVAVCTSSGRVGHSVSLGVAHAVTIVAEDGALADAVATTAGNLVHGPGDIERALERAMKVSGVRGVVVIAEDRIGALGDIEIGPA